MPVCKITAFKTMPNQDLVDENHQIGQILCPHFSAGQEFIVDTRPESFCDWAWSDIHKAYTALMNGESYPGASDENIIIARCRDIIRPVFFKLERIED